MPPANDLIEDIDIHGDPYYLKYYRSFHNHELDPNTILNESQLLDEDMVRNGSLTMLPQGALAIQYYQFERRREICQEGTANQFKFPFDCKSRDVCRFKPIQEGIEPLVVEPSGYGPFLCYVLDDEKTEIDPNVLE